MAWRSRVHTTFLDLASRTVDRRGRSRDDLAVRSRRRRARTRYRTVTTRTSRRRLVWLYWHLGARSAAAAQHQHLSARERARWHRAAELERDRDCAKTHLTNTPLCVLGRPSEPLHMVSSDTSTRVPAWARIPADSNSRRRARWSQTAASRPGKRSMMARVRRLVMLVAAVAAVALAAGAGVRPF